MSISAGATRWENKRANARPVWCPVTNRTPRAMRRSTVHGKGGRGSGGGSLVPGGFRVENAVPGVFNGGRQKAWFSPPFTSSAASLAEMAIHPWIAAPARPEPSPWPAAVPLPPGEGPVAAHGVRPVGRPRRPMPNHTSATSNRLATAALGTSGYGCRRKSRVTPARPRPGSHRSNRERKTPMYNTHRKRSLIGYHRKNCTCHRSHRPSRPH